MRTRTLFAAFAAALTLALAFGLTGCIGGSGGSGSGSSGGSGGASDPEPAPDAGPALPSWVSPTPTTFRPVEMIVAGDDHVQRKFTMVGAEVYLTESGRPMLRVIMDFTNVATVPMTPEEGQDFYVYYEDDYLDSPRYPQSHLGWNAYLRALPGQTIRFAKEFSLDKSKDYTVDFTLQIEHGDSMYLQLIESLGGDATGHDTTYYIAKTSFAAGSLPARPAGEWVPGPYDYTARYKGLAESGAGVTWGGTVEIVGWERGEVEGLPTIKLSISYTNGRDFERSFSSEVNMMVLQNGVELEPAYAYAEDDPYFAGRNAKVAPGANTTVTCEYFLRTDADVAVEFDDLYFDDNGKILLAKVISL